VTHRIYGGRKYLHRLDESVHRSDTAKLALGGRKEKIDDHQKKHKSIQKAKGDIQKRYT